MSITRSERAILAAIWAAEDKILDCLDLNRAADLTSRGGRTVRWRMADLSLIARLDCSRYTITFKGMQALGVTERTA